MKRTQLLRLLLPIFAVGISLASIAGQQPVPTNERPAAFVYVKEAGQKVEVKAAGQNDWNQIQKFARLFPGDSLRISKQTTVLLGDGASRWKEVTGPKAMAITKGQNKRNEFGKFIDRLYSKFFVERQARRFSRAGVRSSDALLLAMPDTSFVYTTPERLQWIKSAPWFTTYDVQITHNQETILDTVVRGTTLENSKFWQRPGNYKVKVTLSQRALLGTETDSCVITLLPESQSPFIKSKLDELKNQAGKKEANWTLVDFCLREKLYLNLEQTLIHMIKKFPNDHEAQAMLYAYYASFLPEEVAERLVMDRLKELR